MPSVTILIPCFNEADVIDAKVRNCQALHAEGLDLEIIVVDDHSTDRTAQAAQAAGARVVPNSGARGKWRAIACGAGQASGDIVCITDADVLIQEHSLLAAATLFEDPTVGAACGMRQMVRRRDDGPHAPCNGLYDRVRMAMIRFYSFLDSSPALCGPMMLVRRELVDKIAGGQLRADDVDVPVQVRKLGFKAKVCPAARFVEFQLPKHAERGQAMRRALGVAQAYWHHRSALLNPRLGAFGLVAYPMEFAFFFLSPFVALAALAAAVMFAFKGSLVALIACAVVLLEELVSALRRVPGALAKTLQMAWAILHYVFGSQTVDDRWQPPPRET